MVLFNSHDIEEHTDSLAYYLPTGDLFSARFIPNTNMRKTLRGLAMELQRYYVILSEVCTEHDINQTQNLITEWENALGIPGTCFSNSGSIEDRRRNLLIVLNNMHGTTVEDYITLAALLGYTIQVESAKVHGGLPAALPLYLFPNGKTVRFTVIIYLPFDSSTTGLPLALPFPLVSTTNKILTCLFNRIKPACVQVFYRYSS